MSLLDVRFEADEIHEKLKDFYTELQHIRKLDSYINDQQLQISIENMINDLGEIIEE